ncbi:SDR family oxidoreductase [Glycomyces arizonensis]|uniref:SDR family oxidoreductase n=1 Tax=Glycomyces arizonensis TaxID=256035 RepID=UPI00042755B0|nr:NAD(P)H-binding protein [Glycomyces arizonensis]
MARFVVIGGSGRIGSGIVRELSAGGHDVSAASRRTGVDTVTGEGLARALAGADVVIDSARPPSSYGDDEVFEFFTTSTANLLAAGTAEGVGHHVTVTTVGTTRRHGIPYYEAKTAQESLVRESGLPYSLVHATQFFEFAGTIAEVSTVDSQVRLPGALTRPIAASDVAKAVARVAVGPPLDGDIEIAGPERFGLDEFVRRVLAARHDPRTVVRDDDAPYFGAVIEEGTLLPVEGARLFETRLDDWLRRTGG